MNGQDKSQPEEVKGVFASAETKALIEYGKKAVQDSPEILMNFIKLMIPLTTVLITTYFALLKFIGIESINSEEFGLNYLGPPILMLISLTAYIVGAFPRAKYLDLRELQSIKDFRSATMNWKYASCIIGSTFFLLAIGLMIYLIGFPPPTTN